MNLVAQRLALKVQFETRRRLVWRAAGSVVSTGSKESLRRAKTPPWCSIPRQRGVKCMSCKSSSCGYVPWSPCDQVSL